MKTLLFVLAMFFGFQFVQADTCVPPKKLDKKYAKKLYKAGRAPQENDLVGRWVWLGYHYDKSLGEDTTEFSCEGIKRDDKLTYVMNFFRDSENKLNMEVIRNESYKQPYGTHFLLRKDKFVYSYFAHHGPYITAYCRVSKKSANQMACPLYWTDSTMLKVVKYAGLLIFERQK